MGHLHRTQIYIAEDQMRELKICSEREDLAVSELIRRAIGAFLKSRAKKVNWKDDPLSKAIGKIKLSVKDASEEHDKYLYGQDRG